MNDELIQELMANEGAEIQSEVGLWRLHVETTNVHPGEGEIPVDFIWQLEGMSEKGLAALGGDKAYDVPVYVNVRFRDDGKVDFKLFVGSASKPRSSTRFEFSPQGDSSEGLTSFMELMDQLLQMTDETIQKYALTWVKQKLAFDYHPSSPEAHPIEQPKPSITQVIKTGDEAAIITAVRGQRLKSDEVIELFSRAKELRSNKLMNLVKMASQTAESTAALLVRRMLLR